MVLTFEHGKGTMTMLPASAITELEFTTSIDKEIDEAEDRIKWLTNDRAENKKKGYWDAREENWYQNDLGESDKRIARLKSYRYPDLYFK